MRRPFIQDMQEMEKFNNGLDSGDVTLGYGDCLEFVDCSPGRVSGFMYYCLCNTPVLYLVG